MALTFLCLHGPLPYLLTVIWDLGLCFQLLSRLIYSMTRWVFHIFWSLIHFQRHDNFWRQSLGCHFGNEAQISRWWFKLPTQTLLGETDVFSPCQETLHKSLILPESWCPHLSKGVKWSRSPYKNGACQDLISKSDSCPPFPPYICLSYFLQTQFNHRKKKTIPSAIICWSTWRPALREITWRIQILPTQTARFNVKMKHNIRERPSVSSRHSKTPFKGIRVAYLVFFQFQIFPPHTHFQWSLYLHIESNRDGSAPASFLLKQVHSVCLICRMIIQMEGK